MLSRTQTNPPPCPRHAAWDRDSPLPSNIVQEHQDKYFHEEVVYPPLNCNAEFR